MKRRNAISPEINRSTYINLTTSHSEEDETETSPFKHPHHTPLDNQQKPTL
jgi:hypothetical protein